MTLVGSRIDHYRILEVLGHGGMGEVFVGYDETLERKVAMKAIRADRRLDAASKARFTREARILSRLDHPNICRIYDYVEGAESDFLVLELIEGRNLGRAIRDGLDHQQMLTVAERVADVLIAAHAEGVVHRDLKPANVMLTEDDEVKVLDFGLARTGESRAPSGSTVPDSVSDGDPDETLVSGDSPTLTRRWSGSSSEMTELGSVVGTPFFMSPEQARGEAVTTASDMYSYGLLLQTLFTGRLPYSTKLKIGEVMEKARRGECRPATGLSADLTQLIVRLCDLAPSNRPTAVEARTRLGFIREKPRRRLRNLTIAALLVIATLAGVKYTLDLQRERSAALEARAEADRRRAQAEDLISFMLGDLRGRLAPVGRLDLLDAVGDQALEYFASLSEEDLTDDELFRRSKALNQIGEVRLDQGSLPQAMQAFEESRRLALDLVERDPDNSEWQLGLGLAQFWIGNLHWSEGQELEALDPWQAYLEITRGLVEKEPLNLEWQLELAYAHGNMGSLFTAIGELDRAIEQTRASIAIKRELLATDPDDPARRHTLSISLSWLAAILETQGRILEALTQYAAEREILETLAGEDPRNADYRELLAINHHHTADLLRDLGQLDHALEHYLTDLGLQSELVELDPENSDWRESLATTQSALGDLSLDLGNVPSALEQYEAARTTMEQLVGQDPTNDMWQLALANSHLGFGRAALLSSAAADALDETNRQIETVERLLENDPEDRRLRCWLSQGYLLRGQALAAGGENRAAADAWARALEIIEPAARDSRDPMYLDPWARALMHLGKRQQAAGVADQLTNAGYQRREFATLFEQVGSI